MSEVILMEKRNCLVCSVEISLAEWKKNYACRRCLRLLEKRNRLMEAVASLWMSLGSQQKMREHPEIRRLIESKNKSLQKVLETLQKLETKSAI